jgi:flagellar basal body-associated protein FliL
MAEHAAPEVQEQPQRPKRSLLKHLLLALNVLLFLAGVGSLAWTKFGPKPVASAVAEGQDQHEEQKGPAAHEPAAKGHEAPAKAPAAAKASGGHGSSAGAKSAGGGSAPTLVPLAPFIVNLSGDQGQRYLRLVAQVEVRGELSKDELEKHLPEVRNRLIFLLSSKTFADIVSTQGKYDLQAEITQNINETLDGPFIKKTYFTEFIVQ